MKKLSIEEAMAAFHRLLRERLATVKQAPEAVAASSSTPWDDEARFDFAERLLRIACRDPKRCESRRCRGTGECRHLADLARRRALPRQSVAGQRPPGATALRHAIWVVMNAQRG